MRKSLIFLCPRGDFISGPFPLRRHSSPHPSWKTKPCDQPRAFLRLPWKAAASLCVAPFCSQDVPITLVRALPDYTLNRIHLGITIDAVVLKSEDSTFINPLFCFLFIVWFSQLNCQMMSAALNPLFPSPYCRAHLWLGRLLLVPPALLHSKMAR